MVPTSDSGPRDRAQSSTPIGFGEQHLLHSMVLQEDRQLNVLLPVEYADSTAKSYPVIYLLDGATDEDFFHVAGLVRYYEAHQMMPPTILVGIANTDRYRDMTYPSKDPRDLADLPTSGGSEAFVQFLQTELPAWLGKSFRTNEQRTLIGQSLAGLLATEVLLKYPGFFQDYIIVSPSLWWDRESLNQQLDSLIANLETVPERVFLSAGTEYPVMVDGSRKLARLLEDKTNATFLHLPAEDHNSILHEALNRAFDQWYDPTVIRDYKYANARSGLILRSAPHRDSARVGKLTYGQALGYIPGPEPVNDTIEELAGQWVYVGSDAGRGWVFDAWVSPVKVFRVGVSIQEYANKELILTDTVIFSIPGREKDAGVEVMRLDENGNKFSFAQYYEGCTRTLSIANLTWSQASVTIENWLTAKHYSKTQIKKRLKNSMSDLWIPPENTPEADGYYLTVYYDRWREELTVTRGCDGAE